jgi:hypothetical protein
MFAPAATIAVHLPSCCPIWKGPAGIRGGFTVVNGRGRITPTETDGLPGVKLTESAFRKVSPPQRAGLSGPIDPPDFEPALYGIQAIDAICRTAATASSSVEAEPSCRETLAVNVPYLTGLRMPSDSDGLQALAIRTAMQSSNPRAVLPAAIALFVALSRPLVCFCYLHELRGRRRDELNLSTHKSLREVGDESTQFSGRCGDSRAERLRVQEQNSPPFSVTSGRRSPDADANSGRGRQDLPGDRVLAAVPCQRAET